MLPRKNGGKKRVELLHQESLACSAQIWNSNVYAGTSRIVIIWYLILDHSYTLHCWYYGHDNNSSKAWELSSIHLWTDRWGPAFLRFITIIVIKQYHRRVDDGIWTTQRYVQMETVDHEWPFFAIICNNNRHTISRLLCVSFMGTM